MNTNFYDKYSVLMSVYCKDEREHFRLALNSMWDQTIPPDEIVLICDGPLTKELNDVISDMQKSHGSNFNVIKLEKNVGLGEALNIGIKVCKNELVARMDSDDYSLPQRCEKQISMFNKDDSLSALGCVIDEFSEEITNIYGTRSVPSSFESVKLYSKRRNPLNHPSVMFKKSDVEKAGGYSQKYPYFEDYYLWIRMLSMDMKIENLGEHLLLMRTNEKTYERRGGKMYADAMMSFHKWLKSIKWESCLTYYTITLGHYFICLSPNFIRKGVYKLIRL